MATVVKERPILFSAPMVRALLAGKKTQTRRVVKTQPLPCHGFPREANGEWGIYLDRPHAGPYKHLGKCPYGQPGDRLWVRETWGQISWSVVIGEPKPPTIQIVYKAGPHSFNRDVPHGWLPQNKWRPSIHMPRSASRLTLELTEVRVERLQAISEADALAEGFAAGDGSPINGFPTESEYSAQQAFADRWDVLNGPRGYPWESNPWVWALTFKAVIDG